MTSYMHKLWCSKEDNLLIIDYWDTALVHTKCNECETQVSFWLGAPQEPWTNFLPEIPDSYRVSTTWPSNSFGLEISYLKDFYCVDYSPFKVSDFERLPSWSDRNLSFWLGQEAEELGV